MSPIWALFYSLTYEKGYSFVKPTIHRFRIRAQICCLSGSTSFLLGNVNFSPAWAK
jgi:hypothetical protein